MSQTINNGIRHVTTRTPVILSRIYKADFQKEGTLTAELRQEITIDSYYPSKKVETNMQNSLFDTKEFGFTEQHFQNTEKRVAWVPVPEGATEEQVKDMLDKANKAGAVIYKVLDSAPILDENQQYAIKTGQRTLDDYANTQAIRYPSNHLEMPDQLCLNNGMVQYRRTFFWNSPKNDIDNRGKGETYMSPELMAELGGVQAAAKALTGQIISDGTEQFPSAIANGSPVTQAVEATI